MAIWEFYNKSTTELEMLREIIHDIEECGIRQSEEMKDALEVELCERSTTFNREPDKVKPLAQYLDEYIEHEVELGNLYRTDLCIGTDAYDSVQEMFEQALDAYQSTENVTIKIERV